MNFYPLRPACDECGKDCHPHESERDFAMWEETQSCRECNDDGYAAEQSELRSLPL